MNSYSYHMSKIKYIIDQIDINWSYSRENPELFNLTEQALDLINLIQGEIRPISWYQNKYKNLIFTQIEDANYIVAVSNSLYEFSFEQAKNARDYLLADGLKHFVIKYESGGQLDWDIRFETTDFLREFKSIYDHAWSIKRSEINPDHYFFTIKKPLELTLAQAVEMANNIKRRYVFVTPIVYYGPQNEKKVIGKFYDNSVQEE